MTAESTTKITKISTPRKLPAIRYIKNSLKVHVKGHLVHQFDGVIAEAAVLHS